MDRDAIGEAIMRHLARHPGAKDSARGVIEWCRAGLGVAPPEDLVEEILEELLRQARIHRSVLVDGTRIYHGPSSP